MIQKELNMIILFQLNIWIMASRYSKTLPNFQWSSLLTKSISCLRSKTRNRQVLDKWKRESHLWLQISRKPKKVSHSRLARKRWSIWKMKILHVYSNSSIKLQMYPKSSKWVLDIICQMSHKAMEEMACTSSGHSNNIHKYIPNWRASNSRKELIRANSSWLIKMDQTNRTSNRVSWASLSYPRIQTSSNLMYFSMRFQLENSWVKEMQLKYWLRLIMKEEKMLSLIGSFLMASTQTTICGSIAMALIWSARSFGNERNSKQRRHRMWRATSIQWHRQLQLEIRTRRSKWPSCLIGAKLDQQAWGMEPTSNWCRTEE